MEDEILILYYKPEPKIYFFVFGELNKPVGSTRNRCMCIEVT